MSEHLPNIDKLFRDAIEGQEEMPSPHLWNELDQRLDKRKMDSISGRYNKLKWVAAALFLVSVGMAMYVYRVQKAVEVVQSGNKNFPSGSMPRKSSKPARAAMQQASGNLAVSPAGPAEKRSEDLHALHNTAGKRPELPPAAKASAPAHAGVLTGAAVSNPAPEKSAAGRVARNNPGTAGQPATSSRSLFALDGKNRSGSSALAEKTRKQAAGKENSVGREEKISLPEKYSSFFRGEVALQQNLPYAAMNQELPEKVRMGNPATLLPLPLRSPVPETLTGPVTGTVHLTPKRSSGFTATVFYSPNLFSTHVTNDGPRNPAMRFPEDDSKTIKEKEENGASWSVGARIDYRLNLHWSIGSGISLLSRETRIQPKMIFARPDERGNVKYRFNCSTGYSFINLKTGGGNTPPPGGTGPFNNPANGDTARTVSSYSKLQYLSVPLVIKYHFGEGRLHFNAGVGVEANFLVSRKIETSITKGNSHGYASTSDIQGLRGVHVSSMLSAAAVYRLNKTFAFIIEPHMQAGFMSINRQAPVKSYVNFYGISTGVVIRL